MVPLERAGQAAARDGATAGRVGRATRRRGASPRRRCCRRCEPIAGRRRRQSATSTAPTLHVLCRSLDQLRAVLDRGVAQRDGRLAGHSRVCRRGRDGARGRAPKSLIATPRIQKPDEMGIFRVHAAARRRRRSWSATWRAWRFSPSRACRRVADFSLNATNELTVDYLRALGAGRVTASYDLNRDQLLDLVAAVPPAWLEVVIHQHMPMFHMEHCVFCAVLSPGTNKHNCGRPCDVHAGAAARSRRHGAPAARPTSAAATRCSTPCRKAPPKSCRNCSRAACATFASSCSTTRRHDEIGRTIDLYRQLLAGALERQGGLDARCRRPIASASPAARWKNAAIRWRSSDERRADEHRPRTPHVARSFGTGNRKKAAELADLLAPLGLDGRNAGRFSRRRSTSTKPAARSPRTRRSRPRGRRRTWAAGCWATTAGWWSTRSTARLASIRPAMPAPPPPTRDNRQKLLASSGGRAARAAHGPLRLPPGAGRSDGQRCVPKPPAAARAASAARKPGSGGFGYDPLFEVVEYHRTFGELSPRGQERAEPSGAGHVARSLPQLEPSWSPAESGTRVADTVRHDRQDVLRPGRTCWPTSCAALGAADVRAGRRMVLVSRRPAADVSGQHPLPHGGARCSSRSHTFTAADEASLYRGIGQVDWLTHLDAEGSLAIDPVVHSPIFTQFALRGPVGQGRDRRSDSRSPRAAGRRSIWPIPTCGSTCTSTASG